MSTHTASQSGRDLQGGVSASGVQGPPLEPVQYSLKAAAHLLGSESECKLSQSAVERARELAEMLENALKSGRVELGPELVGQMETLMHSLCQLVARSSYWFQLEELLTAIRSASEMGESTASVRGRLVKAVAEFVGGNNLLDEDLNNLRLCMQSLAASRSFE